MPVEEAFIGGNVDTGKVLRLPLNTVPSLIVLNTSKSELLCLHLDKKDEEYGKDPSREWEAYSLPHFKLSSLKTDTLKLLWTSTGSVDFQDYSPVEGKRHTRAELSPDGKHMAVTVGHEELSYCQFFKTSKTLEPIMEEGMSGGDDTHASVFVYFVTNDMFFFNLRHCLENAGNGWYKRRLGESTSDYESHNQGFVNYDDEHVSFLRRDITGQFYAIRRTIESERESMASFGRFSSEIAVHDTQTDQLLRTYRIANRESRFAYISADFTEVYDCEDNDQHESPSIDCGPSEVRIWKTNLSEATLLTPTGKTPPIYVVEAGGTEEVPNFIYLTEENFTENGGGGDDDGCDESDEEMDEAYGNQDEYSSSFVQFVTSDEGVDYFAVIVKRFGTLIVVNAKTGFRQVYAIKGTPVGENCREPNIIICNGSLLLFGYFEDKAKVWKTPFHDNSAHMSATGIVGKRSDKRTAAMINTQQSVGESMDTEVKNACKKIALSAPADSNEFQNTAQVIRLECIDKTSNKFYEMTIDELTVLTRYGKIDSTGVSSSKTFGNHSEVNEFVDKTVAEKLKKGYIRVGIQEPLKAMIPVLMLPQVEEEYAHSVKSNTKAKDKSKAKTKAAAHDIQPDPLPVVEKFESKGGEGPANSAVSIGKFSNAKSSSKAGTDSENAIRPCNESVMLQCVDKTSNKFYEMKLELNFGQPKVTSRYGKIGSAGVTSFKEYASAEEAKKAYDNTLKEKIKKGYA